MEDEIVSLKRDQIIDSIGWRKYLLPSRVTAYIYLYPILRTANSIADILVYNYA